MKAGLTDDTSVLMVSLSQSHMGDMTAAASPMADSQLHSRGSFSELHDLPIEMCDRMEVNNNNHWRDVRDEQ